MANDLTRAFQYEGKSVRTHVREDGTVLFHAADTGKCLGIKNMRDALLRLDDDEKQTVVIADTLGKLMSAFLTARLDDDERQLVGIADPSGRVRKTTFITEAGLYKMIFTSRVEKAKAFTRWVTPG